MRRVGIFGGTFNPPHLGHLNIVTEFIRKMELDEVLIIPACVPPHKAAPDLAAAELRLDMCRHAFQELPVTVSSIEMEREGKSYTYDTLQELTRQYAERDAAEGNDEGTQFFFLMGDDMLLYFPHWYRAKGILSLCTVVSSIRSNAVSIEALEAFAKTNFPEEYDAGKFVFLHMTPVRVSSSQIRERVYEGQDIRQLVTPYVADLIQEKGLYKA